MRAPCSVISLFFSCSTACSSSGRCLKACLHQILDRLLLLGNLFDAHAVGGNHRGSHQRRIVQVAGDGLLDDLLLVVQGALRADQRLLVGGHSRVGVHHVQRGHGADLQLLAVVAGQLGALLQGALLGLHILIGAAPVPSRCSPPG